MPQDVVSRINRWLEDEDAADADETLHDARDEIVALRALLKRQTVAAHQALTRMGKYAEQTGFLLGGLEMTAAGHTTAEKVLKALKAKYRDDAEIERLTDAERFVLREVRDIYADEDDLRCNEISAVIDGLLERTK